MKKATSKSFGKELQSTTRLFPLDRSVKLQGVVGSEAAMRGEH